MTANWRQSYRPPPDPSYEDIGPRLVWRPVDDIEWSGSSGDGQLRAHVVLMDGGWLAWIQLEDPPGASPATTVGTYDTVEQAQAATDDFWEAHRRDDAEPPPDP